MLFCRSSSRWKIISVFTSSARRVPFFYSIQIEVEPDIWRVEHKYLSEAEGKRESGWKSAVMKIEPFLLVMHQPLISFEHADQCEHQTVSRLSLATHHWWLWLDKDLNEETCVRWISSFSPRLHVGRRTTLFITDKGLSTLSFSVRWSFSLSLFSFTFAVFSIDVKWREKKSVADNTGEFGLPSKQCQECAHV